MTAKYHKIDEFVLEGLAKSRDELEDWAATLPSDLCVKVLGIVDAVELGDLSSPSAMRNQLSIHTNAKPVGKLQGWPLSVSIFGVLVGTVGVFASVLAETPIYFAACGAVAGIALVCAALQQRKLSKDWSTAFGIGTAVGREQEGRNFVSLQALIFLVTATFLLLGLFLPTLLLLFYLVGLLDRLILPQQDSMPAACIRLACVGILITLAWTAWKKCSPRGVLFLRSFRGLLVDRLPPICVSWLYEKQSGPPLEDTPEPVWKVALKNTPLVGVAAICLLYITRSDLADTFLDIGSKFEDGKKLRVLFLIAQWVARRPSTTLLLSVVAGPAALGLYAFRVASAAKAVRVRSIGLAILTLSLIAFIAMSLICW